MRTEISVRLPNDMAEKLAQITEETQKLKSYHIRKALELYLVEVADWQVAYDRLHDTTDPVICSENIRKELEL